MLVLTHFPKYLLGLEKAQTQTTTNERDCLSAYAASARLIVEVGVWHGVTTKLLRSAMAPDGRIFAVDPFAVGRLGVSLHRQVAVRELAKERNGTVVWLRMTGEAAAEWYLANVREPVDLIFIDGDHSWKGLESDWMGWSPLVGVGGLVALHDSKSSETRSIENAGSVQYTRAVISEDRRFDSVAEIDSLTLFRRIA